MFRICICILCTCIQICILLHIYMNIILTKHIYCAYKEICTLITCLHMFLRQDYSMSTQSSRSEHHALGHGIGIGHGPLASSLSIAKGQGDDLGPGQNHYKAKPIQIYAIGKKTKNIREFNISNNNIFSDFISYLIIFSYIWLDL